MFIFSKNYRAQTNTFTRFLLVGVLNTAVGLSTMFLLLYIFQVSYWWSTFIGNSIGAAVSYLLNRTFTFQSHVTHGKGVIRFIAVILLCYLFAFSSSKMLTGFMERFVQNNLWGMQEDLSVLLGTALYTMLNYLGQKKFVFHK